MMVDQVVESTTKTKLLHVVTYKKQNFFGWQMKLQMGHLKKNKLDWD